MPHRRKAPCPGTETGSEALGLVCAPVHVCGGGRPAWALLAGDNGAVCD